MACAISRCMPSIGSTEHLQLMPGHGHVTSCWPVHTCPHACADSAHSEWHAHRAVHLRHTSMSWRPAEAWACPSSRPRAAASLLCRSARSTLVAATLPAPGPAAQRLSQVSGVQPSAALWPKRHELAGSCFTQAATASTQPEIADMECSQNNIGEEGRGLAMVGSWDGQAGSLQTAH